MKQLPFFADRADLLEVLQLVEAKGPLVYTRMGRVTEGEPQFFHSGATLPRLGEATADTTSACESFLVSERDAVVQLRVVHQIDGTTAALVDQLVNPDTVTFTPGGSRQGALISGRVATASESARSRALMNRFHSVLRKRFRKIRAFYVGPHAEQMLDAGMRLTISLQGSTEFDLTRSGDPDVS